jgi:hypothetical protein
MDAGRVTRDPREGAPVVSSGREGGALAVGGQRRGRVLLPWSCPRRRQPSTPAASEQRRGKGEGDPAAAADGPPSTPRFGARRDSPPSSFPAVGPARVRSSGPSRPRPSARRPSCPASLLPLPCDGGMDWIELPPSHGGSVEALAVGDGALSYGGGGEAQALGSDR